ncbi:hypothetical protein L917_03312 [Phytophthora nicotianae]|uniref:Uncharacterized protein n=1 Tax=Phytophthora nicotianae TaxID=4792 RepID=W2JK43_PHYNI|nr:hypothetical protein L915_03436 [Phytophthora nicotianae]ETL46796.1 hypothetical protein L916_03388 [Phytophthora nicotianae]ETL99917.1 hypothetical protein L917_03312 [Phytophthora nicotianae]ETM53079.1 hypothetical protein L914_03414 [Phytophthora nicotianae]
MKETQKKAIQDEAVEKSSAMLLAKLKNGVSTSV